MINCTTSAVSPSVHRSSQPVEQSTLYSPSETLGCPEGWSFPAQPSSLVDKPEAERSQVFSAAAKQNPLRLHDPRINFPNTVRAPVLWSNFNENILLRKDLPLAFTALINL